MGKRNIKNILKDKIKTIYNFDGYYKGKTINKDLKEFDFDTID